MSRSKKPGTLRCRLANDPEFNCQQTFATEISELRHFGLAHGPKAPWRRKPGVKCPQCPILFRNQAGMREHLRSAHNIVNYSAVLPTSEEFRNMKTTPSKRAVGRPRKLTEVLIPTEFIV